VFEAPAQHGSAVFPPVLIVTSTDYRTLDRYGQQTGVVDRCPIRPTPTLNIDFEGARHRYDLCAVAAHLGQTARSGHYVSFDCRSPERVHLANDDRAPVCAAATPANTQLMHTHGVVYMYTRQ
jgi:hypothetical protein